VIVLPIIFHFKIFDDQFVSQFTPYGLDNLHMVTASKKAASRGSYNKNVVRYKSDKGIIPPLQSSL
jgi:hypothetical protein